MSSPRPPSLTMAVAAVTVVLYTPLILRLFGVELPGTVPQDGSVPDWLFETAEATPPAGAVQ